MLLNIRRKKKKSGNEVSNYAAGADIFVRGGEEGVRGPHFWLRQSFSAADRLFLLSESRARKDP